MVDAPIWKIGGFNIDISAVGMIIISAIIVFIIARLCVRNLSVDNPGKLQNFLEWVVEFVQGVVASTMDLKKGKVYIVLGLTLLLFIFVGNVIGLPFAILIDHMEEVTLFGHTIVSQEQIADWQSKGYDGARVLWWKSPTADISVTLGLAFVVFCVIHQQGFTKNRKHYLKHYFEPYWFFFPLNVLKEIFKPITLGIRLYANIFAGEIMIKVIIMAGVLGIPFLTGWLGFKMFISGLQAYIFIMLTMVYISQAAIHEDH